MIDDSPPGTPSDASDPPAASPASDEYCRGSRDRYSRRLADEN
jgi:hypothetical protein